jgi:hypothetical protein
MEENAYTAEATRFYLSQTGNGNGAGAALRDSVHPGSTGIGRNIVRRKHDFSLLLVSGVRR